ncbi:hypothetical protein PHMEG_00011845 [Phytophthora megakarya]|uniref:Uncharacterized protein n=1 Tax=Phytophthora megakarya TaxID=4795 RepID=A0A225WCE0_9STRA|nr:hypothetical protein PHMEG_00011845 [Phytophthora megakarya]
MRSSHECAERARRREQERQARYYNRRKVRNKRSFRVGDRVWMYRPPRGPKATKFVHAWVGPMKIIDEVGYENFLLEREDGEHKEQVVANVSFGATCSSSSFDRYGTGTTVTMTVSGRGCQCSSTMHPSKPARSWKTLMGRKAYNRCGTGTTDGDECSSDECRSDVAALDDGSNRAVVGLDETSKTVVRLQFGYCSTVATSSGRNTGGAQPMIGEGTDWTSCELGVRCAWGEREPEVGGNQVRGCVRARESDGEGALGLVPIWADEAHSQKRALGSKCSRQQRKGEEQATPAARGPAWTNRRTKPAAPAAEGRRS